MGRTSDRMRQRRTPPRTNSMGYIRHDAIIATSGNAKHLALAWEKARTLKLPISSVVLSPMNGYGSFLIAPDGSKEGWPDSDEGEKRKGAWIRWMREQDETWVDWVLVRYCGDDDSAEVHDFAGNPMKASEAGSGPSPTDNE